MEAATLFASLRAEEQFDWAQVVLVLLLLFGGAAQAIWRRVHGDQKRAQGGQRRRQPAPPSGRPRAPAPPAGWSELFGDLPREGEEVELESFASPESLESLESLGQVPVAGAPAPARTRAPAPAGPPESLSELVLDRPSGHMPGATDLAQVPSEAELSTEFSEDLTHAIPQAEVEHVGLRRRILSGDAWLDAVVAAEVLGRPLSMRSHDELPGSIPR